MKRQKWFRKLFRFLEDIRSQSLKMASLRSQGLYEQTNFSLDTDIFIFLNIAFGCINTPKYLFSPDCSFKIFEKPSKFSQNEKVCETVFACSHGGPGRIF